MTEKFLGFPAAAGFDKKGEAMPDRDEDRKRALIDAVVDALGGSGKSAKSMQNFARTLYSGAPLEDLSAYTEAELAKLAEDTFALAGTHRPGTTTVLVSNPDSPSEGGALERVTVVDVVNENMPFLLDSAMAELNERGLELFRRNGYRPIGRYLAYYADHTNALRFEKTIRGDVPLNAPTPYYEQTTDFTCGPCCLMMALARYRTDFRLDPVAEVRLWREATTIFMMS